MTALAAPRLRAPARSRRPDWRKVGLASASAAINVALIAALSFSALGIDEPVVTPQQPILYVDIMPRPLLPDERPRIVVQPSAETAATTAPADAPRTVSPTHRRADAAGCAGPDRSLAGRPERQDQRHGAHPASGFDRLHDAGSVDRR